MNYESKTYKLYYQDRLIGEISNIDMDWPWLIADLATTEAFEEFREGFAFLTNEDNEERFNGERPIDLDNWFIADEQDNRVEVYLAIHNGDEIWWRWTE